LFYKSSLRVVIFVILDLGNVLNAFIKHPRWRTLAILK